MATPETTALEVQVPAPSPAPAPDGTVEVPLEKPVEPTVDAKDQKIAELEAQLKSLTNRVAGAQRIEQEKRELRQKIDQLEREKKSNPVTPEALEDAFNRLVEEGKPIAAVDKVVKQGIQEALEQEKLDRVRQERQQQELRVFESSKQKVVSLYPELDPETGDESAPESKLYNEAMNELVKDDPLFIYDKRGPVIALGRMHELMLERGMTPRVRPGTTNENVPRPRMHGGLPPSRPGSKGNTYVLTKEQREAADAMGMKYEDYARTAKQLETQGGVEVA